MIIFTDRELHRAWRENKKASFVINKTNAHRLLLFYAVECGLKAVLMKRESKNRTDLCAEKFEQAQHNINRLLDFLGADSSLKLPSQLKMSTISKNRERKFPPGDINQMWRYGGKCEGTDDLNIKYDKDIEIKLLELCKWIEQELR